jgi:hypothetical protein
MAPWLPPPFWASSSRSVQSIPSRPCTGRLINGVVAVPVMAIMMLMTAQPRIMGKFTITGWLRWLGWASTIAMAACVVGMAVGWFIPE